MTLLHMCKWWTSNRCILSFCVVVPHSSSFWSSWKIAFTCNTFIVPSWSKKIVDFYLAVLLNKILLAVQVVLFIVYRTSIRTQFPAHKPLALKNPCRCFNSGCKNSSHRFVENAKPWNLKLIPELIIYIDMGKNNQSLNGWNCWVLVSVDGKFGKFHTCIYEITCSNILVLFSFLWVHLQKELTKCLRTPLLHALNSRLFSISIHACNKVVFLQQTRTC